MQLPSNNPATAPGDDIEIPKEFTRPQVVEILKFMVHFHTAEQARELGPEYMIEKWLLKEAGLSPSKDPSFPSKA